jgi:mRNA-degrading endonuclease RelE of RelBE toxin-antitoxin system
VKSDRKRWTIKKIASSTYHNILSLDIKYQELVEKKLGSLQDNPYEGDIKKIQGKKNIYRGRIGDYRFYFRTFPESKSIEILLFEHRSDIKKKTIQRLI